MYEVFGISKQAYYQRIKRQKKQIQIEEIVLQQIALIRKERPKTGGRKLYKELQPFFKKHDIKMGRDKLFTLLRRNNLLVKKTKRFHITTNSKHFFYTSPNLLKTTKITHAEQVFVSDITYIKTDNGHAYAAIVTDAYSKKIMGWQLADNMGVTMVKEALEMAHKNCIFNTDSIIHHSDRGIQYCCPDYTNFAKQKGFEMSTTQKYDPYENAVAERINGILKYEFGLRRTLPDVETARKVMRQAVEIYNNKRLHWSLDLETPQNVHEQYDTEEYKSYSKKSA